MINNVKFLRKYEMTRYKKQAQEVDLEQGAVPLWMQAQRMGTNAVDVDIQSRK